MVSAAGKEKQGHVSLNLESRPPLCPILKGQGDMYTHSRQAALEKKKNK